VEGTVYGTFVVVGIGALLAVPTLLTAGQGVVRGVSDD